MAGPIPDLFISIAWGIGHGMMAACELLMGLHLLLFSRTHYGAHLRHIRPVFDQYGWVMVWTAMAHLAAISLLWFPDWLVRILVLMSIIGVWGVSVAVTVWLRRDDVSAMTKS